MFSLQKKRQKEKTIGHAALKATQWVADVATSL